VNIYFVCKRFARGTWDLPEALGIVRGRRQVGVVMLLDDRMRLRYWMRRDLNEDQSRADCTFPAVSAWRIVGLELKAHGVEVDRELDLE